MRLLFSRSRPNMSTQNQMRRAAIRPTSLDAPLGEDESNTVADVVADENAQAPYKQLEEKMSHFLGTEDTITTTGAHECLVVGCSESDRPRVREVIEGLHETVHDVTDLDLRPVVFEDERPTTST